MRGRERGSIGGGPLAGLFVTAIAATIVAVQLLPDDSGDPSLAAIASHMPLWVKVVVAVAVYAIPIALSAMQWRGFTDREAPRAKAIDAARWFGFAPGLALGALLGGRILWACAGAAAGVASGLVVAALLRAALPARES